MNSCKVNVHAQEEEKKTEKHKTWTQDSIESKYTLYIYNLILNILLIFTGLISQQGSKGYTKMVIV